MLRNSHSVLLELRKEFSKVADHKTNIEKSITFLYTSNEQSEIEFKKRIPFTIALKGA